jgi:hypothetical protein
LEEQEFHGSEVQPDSAVALDRKREAQPFRNKTRFFLRLRWEKRGSPVGEQPTHSTDDHGIASVMPAWTAGIQARRDASADIHVNLGSGTPCRNDDTEANAKHRKTLA